LGAEGERGGAFSDADHGDECHMIERLLTKRSERMITAPQK
jgi:hypothetical protein